MPDPVRVLHADGVSTITLDQPDRRNALTADLVDGLGDALAEASADDATRVVVLTNTGPAFCAGANLKQDDDRSPRYTLAELFGLVLDSPKPVVGRIAGHCTGGGVGLAAACDISLVADDVQFGFTEVRIGVAPAIISVVCLPKMRRADAAELFLTGQRIDADRAAEVGLVNRAVPRHELDGAVDDLVGMLMSGGPEALAASKSLVTRVPGLEREAAFAWTSELSARLFASDEARAGMRAFRDRTPPPWARTDDRKDSP